MRLRSAACLALLLPLAACTNGGGDDDAVTAFCEQGESALAEIDATGALGDDAAGFADAVGQISDGFAEADPPADIAADWNTLGGVFADLHESLDGVDPEDSEAFAGALTEFSEQASSTELADASDRITTYLSDNCAE